MSTTAAQMVCFWNKGDTPDTPPNAIVENPHAPLNNLQQIVGQLDLTAEYCDPAFWIDTFNKIVYLCVEGDEHSNTTDVLKTDWEDARIERFEELYCAKNSSHSQQMIIMLGVILPVVTIALVAFAIYCKRQRPDGNDEEKQNIINNNASP